MAKNKWGYSLDNTDFSKIPTLANHAKIKDIDHAPASTEKTSQVYIGAKISSDLPSGSYSKNVVFSAVTHSPVRYMQNFSCSELQNVGDTITLPDMRDGEMYSIAKLADGQCWMTKDLMITAKEMYSDDTDLPDGEKFRLVQGYSTAFVNNDVAYKYLNPVGSPEHRANYYSYRAATAGWGYGDNLQNGAISPKSICPKGWRLPTGGPNSDFETLVSHYSTVEALTSEPVNLNINDTFVTSSTLQEYGEFYLWSATASGIRYSDWGYEVYTLHVEDSSNPQYQVVDPSVKATLRGNGYLIRCIARN